MAKNGLVFNQQPLLRQHRLHPFVLPTAHRAVDAARTGSAFLRACAALVNRFLFKT